MSTSGINSNFYPILGVTTDDCEEFIKGLKKANAVFNSLDELYASIGNNPNIQVKQRYSDNEFEYYSVHYGSSAATVRVRKTAPKPQKTNAAQNTISNLINDFASGKISAEDIKKQLDTFANISDISVSDKTVSFVYDGKTYSVTQITQAGQQENAHSKNSLARLLKEYFNDDTLEKYFTIVGTVDGQGELYVMNAEGKALASDPSVLRKVLLIPEAMRKIIDPNQNYRCTAKSYKQVLSALKESGISYGFDLIPDAIVLTFQINKINFRFEFHSNEVKELKKERINDAVEGVEFDNTKLTKEEIAQILALLQNDDDIKNYSGSLLNFSNLVDKKVKTLGEDIIRNRNVTEEQKNKYYKELESKVKADGLDDNQVEKLLKRLKTSLSNFKGNYENFKAEANDLAKTIGAQIKEEDRIKKLKEFSVLLENHGEFSSLNELESFIATEGAKYGVNRTDLELVQTDEGNGYISYNVVFTQDDIPSAAIVVTASENDNKDIIKLLKNLNNQNFDSIENLYAAISNNKDIVVTKRYDNNDVEYYSLEYGSLSVTVTVNLSEDYKLERYIQSLKGKTFDSVEAVEAEIAGKGDVTLYIGVDPKYQVGCSDLGVFVEIYINDSADSRKINDDTQIEHKKEEVGSAVSTTLQNNLSKLKIYYESLVKQDNTDFASSVFSSVVQNTIKYFESNTTFSNNDVIKKAEEVIYNIVNDPIQLEHNKNDVGSIVGTYLGGKMNDLIAYYKQKGGIKNFANEVFTSVNQAVIKYFEENTNFSNNDIFKQAKKVIDDIVAEEEKIKDDYVSEHDDKETEKIVSEYLGGRMQDLIDYYTKQGGSKEVNEFTGSVFESVRIAVINYFKEHNKFSNNNIFEQAKKVIDGIIDEEEEDNENDQIIRKNLEEIFTNLETEDPNNLKYLESLKNTTGVTVDVTEKNGLFKIVISYSEIKKSFTFNVDETSKSILERLGLIGNISKEQKLEVLESIKRGAINFGINGIQLTESEADDLYNKLLKHEELQGNFKTVQDFETKARELAKTLVKNIAAARESVDSTPIEYDQKILDAVKDVVNKIYSFNYNSLNNLTALKDYLDDIEIMLNINTSSMKCEVTITYAAAGYISPTFLFDIDNQELSKVLPELQKAGIYTNSRTGITNEQRKAILKDIQMSYVKSDKLTQKQANDLYNQLLNHKDLYNFGSFTIDKFKTEALKIASKIVEDMKKQPDDATLPNVNPPVADPNILSTVNNVIQELKDNNNIDEALNALNSLEGLIKQGIVEVKIIKNGSKYEINITYANGGIAETIEFNNNATTTSIIENNLKMTTDTNKTVTTNQKFAVLANLYNEVLLEGDLSSKEALEFYRLLYVGLINLSNNMTLEDYKNKAQKTAVSIKNDILNKR